MAVIFKPKRSESSGSVPTSSDLEVGEIAINPTDKTIYTKTAAGNVVKLANYAEADPGLVFPTGDLGGLTGSQDAFGQTLVATFDSLDTPNGTLTTQDLGTII